MPMHGAKYVSNLKIQNVWMEHWKVGLWADAVNSIFMNGCRIRNTFADGINFATGTRNSIGTNLDLRNTGDDALAMWSKTIVDENNKYLRNTVALPTLANHIALYGGKNIEVKHNHLKDTIYNGSGINVSTNFEPELFEGDILISENLLERTGGINDHVGGKVGGIWFNVVPGFDIDANILVENNSINDSTYQGISFFNGGDIRNTIVQNNEITNSSTYGIEIDSRLSGQIILKDNKINKSGIDDLINNAGDKFIIEVE